jgi:hypothetical protein
MTLYTCTECRQTTIPPRLVESTDRGGICDTVPAALRGCEPACRDLARAPQGEAVRLFTPAPAQLPGQLNL